MSRAILRAGTALAPVLAVLLPLLAATGCTPAGMAVGAASTVGIAAVQERSLGDAAEDTRIRVALNDVFLSRDLTMFSSVDFAVVEGRVLLVGQVASEEDRDYAARRVWAIDGVKELINELEVGPAPGVKQVAEDRWISTRLKAALLGDSTVADVNYWILVDNGTVYLLGVAQSQAEIDRVIAHARNIPGVRGVVNHVILKTDPRRAS